jgi:mortality factor 4-like protein 1
MYLVHNFHNICLWRLEHSFINVLFSSFSWDEWVPESRVLKYNEANVQKQKELQKAQEAQQ